MPLNDQERSELRSDNPARPSFPARLETTPVAVMVDVLSNAEVKATR